jgi:Na+-driven multidrug efflux pump
VLLVGVPVAWLAVNVFDQSITGVWMGILTGGVAAMICSVLMVRHLMWRSDPTLKAVAARA